jgi:hypothetical protein
MAASDVVWRVFREGDEGPINVAFEEAHGVSRSLDEWAWKFAPEADGRAIVLAESDGKVISHCAGIPLKITIDGPELNAARIADVFSTTSRTPDSAGADTSVRSVQAFFDTFGAGGRFALVFGFSGPLDGVTTIFQMGFDVVAERPVTSFFRRAPVASPIRRLLYRAEAARDWEPRLNDLWHRVRDSYPVAVVRDADYALRRFAGRCAVRYHRFLVFPRFSRRAVAYAVFRTDGKRCRWVDLLWDHGHPGALELLARVSARLSHQNSATKEEIWLAGDPQARTMLEGLGFAEDDSPPVPEMAARSFAPEVDPAVFIERAFLTMADTDGA